MKMKKTKLYDLSQPFGHNVPLWPYFEDVKIERVHYHAKSGVLSQKITTVMHCSTHADSPAHVIEGTQFTDEIPLEKYYGTGVVVRIPKRKWGVITPEDLEKARPKIEKGDIVIINTGWHKYWGDSTQYFCYSPGLYREAGEWFAAKGVKAVGVDQQALDHPLATAIGPHGPGPLRPDVCAEYKKQTGHDVKQDFPEWEPCHRLLLGNGIMGWENVGGDIDKVTGKRVTIAGFPIRWVKGDGSIVRLVAIVEE
jgi:kynurenine formamidase